MQIQVSPLHHGGPMSSTIAQAYTDLNSQIGDPGSGFGLFASVENLEASLKALQATPE